MFQCSTFLSAINCESLSYSVINIWMLATHLDTRQKQLSSVTISSSMTGWDHFLLHLLSDWLSLQRRLWCQWRHVKSVQKLSRGEPQGICDCPSPLVSRLWSDRTEEVMKEALRGRSSPKTFPPSSLDSPTFWWFQLQNVYINSRMMYYVDHKSKILIYNVIPKMKVLWKPKAERDYCIHDIWPFSQDTYKKGM